MSTARREMASGGRPTCATSLRKEGSSCRDRKLYSTRTDVARASCASGAGTLYLGISDAGLYNGAPGAYGDNAGFYTVNFNVMGANSGGGGTTSTPEPWSLMLIGTGLLGLVSLRRKVLGR
jgi:hypothetical protein